MVETKFEIVNFWEDIQGTIPLTIFNISNKDEIRTTKSHNDFYVDISHKGRKQLEFTEIIHPEEHAEIPYRMWVTEKYESVHLPNFITRFGLTPLVPNDNIKQLYIEDLKKFKYWVYSESLLS